MNIVIYIDSLKSFTTGTPHRGVLKELIKIRSDDYFILVLRKGSIPTYLKETLKEIGCYRNWELKIVNTTTTISNILALFKYKNHCKIYIKGDIYLNFDSQFLGQNNRPQLITVHDLSSIKKTSTSSLPFFKQKSRKFTVSNGIKNADQLISISDFTRNDIKTHFNISNSIKVIYNGIDLKWHDYKFVDNTLTETYWIWWGNFSPRKNLINTLIAYNQFLDENINLISKIPDFRLIGDDNKYFYKIKKFIDNSEMLTKKVFFKRSLPIEKLIIEVANSKGLIFPSLYEGFGLPVIESFSQGVPVLTSNKTSLPEISNGKAILVDPDDISMIKKGLYSLNSFVGKDKSKDLKKWASNFTYYKAALEYSNLIDNCFLKASNRFSYHNEETLYNEKK